jgi:hypothetical protein
MASKLDRAPVAWMVSQLFPIHNLCVEGANSTSLVMSRIGNWRVSRSCQNLCRLVYPKLTKSRRLFQGPGIADMVASWPHGLAELTIRHCRTCPLLTDRAAYATVEAAGIKTLTLQDSHHAMGRIHLLRVFTVFPALLNLTLPAEAVVLGVPDMTNLDLPLETLELTRRESDDDGALRDFWKQDLLQCIVNLPHLWQLAVDERCLSRTIGRPQPGYEIDDRDELTLPLKQRAEARNRDAGREDVNLDEAGFFFLTG